MRGNRLIRLPTTAKVRWGWSNIAKAFPSMGCDTSRRGGMFDLTSEFKAKKMMIKMNLVAAYRKINKEVGDGDGDGGVLHCCCSYEREGLEQSKE